MAANTCRPAPTAPAKGARELHASVFNLFGRLPAPDGARSQITRRARAPLFIIIFSCAVRYYEAPRWVFARLGRRGHVNRVAFNNKIIYDEQATDGAARRPANSRSAVNLLRRVDARWVTRTHTCIRGGKK